METLPFISGEDEINDDTCSILDDAPRIASQLSESTSIPTSQATVTPSAHLTTGQSVPVDTPLSSSTEPVPSGSNMPSPPPVVSDDDSVV